jgi:hypothetical protein
VIAPVMAAASADLLIITVNNNAIETFMPAIPEREDFANGLEVSAGFMERSNITELLITAVTTKNRDGLLTGLDCKYDSGTLVSANDAIAGLKKVTALDAVTHIDVPLDTLDRNRMAPYFPRRKQRNPCFPELYIRGAASFMRLPFLPNVTARTSKSSVFGDSTTRRDSALDCAGRAISRSACCGAASLGSSEDDVAHRGNVGDEMSVTEARGHCRCPHWPC